MEIFCINCTRSPSLLYMACASAILSLTKVNWLHNNITCDSLAWISRFGRKSSLEIPSKHFFRWGCTRRGSLVSDKISSISSLDKKKNLPALLKNIRKFVTLTKIGQKTKKRPKMFTVEKRDVSSLDRHSVLSWYCQGDCCNFAVSLTNQALRLLLESGIINQDNRNNVSFRLCFFF